MRDGFVKVAAVTPDIKVADCRYNMESIKKEISRCRKEAVKIAVFSGTLYNRLYVWRPFFTGYTFRGSKKSASGSC